ncbi:hypothetical protein [Streptomyces sp. KS 21]|uniref:hypothetical protein n=1 Tax=Streptomyces sp. KS 21 TaxID=2485150 RepID=UPI0010637F0E|nr:hypothetical protein [Streptomyces sp. KS 21]TDU67085.1 hypothetical protein EDD91_8117 [Streptomyces sp. KS 21]
MTASRTDPVYGRYMQAFSASTKHTGSCTACQSGQVCEAGAPIHAAFAAAQDAYLARQSAKRRT